MSLAKLIQILDMKPGDLWSYHRIISYCGDWLTVMNIGPLYPATSVSHGNAPQWSKWKCVMITTSIFVFRSCGSRYVKSGNFWWSLNPICSPQSSMIVKLLRVTRIHERPTSQPEPSGRTEIVIWSLCYTGCLVWRRWWDGLVDEMTRARSGGKWQNSGLEMREAYIHPCTPVTIVFKSTKKLQGELMFMNCCRYICLLYCIWTNHQFLRHLLVS